MKISSAHRAAKSWPRPDEPACRSTGRPWGERGTVSGPADAEPLPLVVELVDLVRVGEGAALPVEDEGVVLPGVPEAGRRLEELVGPVVAGVVGEDLLHPVVLGLAVVDRGDDVPGGPAPGEVVEGGERAGHVEGRVVGGRVGGARARSSWSRRRPGRARSTGRASPGGPRAGPPRPPSRRRCRAWRGGRRRTSGRSSPPRGSARASGSSSASRKPCSVAGWRQEPEYTVTLPACMKPTRDICRGVVMVRRASAPGGASRGRAG